MRMVNYVREVLNPATSAHKDASSCREMECNTKSNTPRHDTDSNSSMPLYSNNFSLSIKTSFVKVFEALTLQVGMMRSHVIARFDIQWTDSERCSGLTLNNCIFNFTSTSTSIPLAPVTFEHFSTHFVPITTSCH